MKHHKKYLNLPKEFRMSHDNCVFLINQIEEFVIDKTYDKLRFQEISIKSEKEIKPDEHIFDFLVRTERLKEYEEIVRNNLINALISDVCYFTQTALLCSLQRRLTVTFALLRKPFVYNLLVFLRIMFEDDFLNKFNDQEGFDTTSLTNIKKKELIKKSLSCLITKSITENDIFDFIFNNTNPDSLINMTNKALHLSTTRNKYNKTEIQNLNFIFKNYENNLSQWNYIYKRLPMLLLYYVEIIESLVFNILDVPQDKYLIRLYSRAKALKIEKL